MIALPKNIKEVIGKVNKLDNFSDMEVEYYAVEKGAAHIIANSMGEKMKVNQLRKFFDQVKKFQLENCKGKEENKNIDIKKLYILLPELAYALGRRLITKEFYNLMKIIIRDNNGKTRLKTVVDFNNFVEFLAAVLAYHKAKLRIKIA